MKKLNRFLSLLVVCLVCLLPFRPVYAGALYGSVIEVLDGATITVKVDNRLIKVRLCTVLAPKKDQAMAEIAKSHLASLLAGSQVLVAYKGLSADGSIDAVVTLNDVDMGMQMVRDGAASYNRAYDDVLSEQTRRLYAESEQAARTEARGIWQNAPALSAKEFVEPNVPAATSVAISPNEESQRLNHEAYLLVVQHNYKAALPKCREAIRLNPSNASAHKNLGIILAESGHPEQGLLELQEALRLNPDLYEAHNVVGNLLAGLGNYSAAIAEYEEAIRLYPKFAKAHYNLGVAFTWLKQYPKALVAYQEAQRLAPEQPVILINIGWVLYRMGKHAEGREYWKRVLTLGDQVAVLLAEENLANYR